MPQRVGEVLFGVSVLMNAGLWAAAWLWFPRGDPNAVLHYTSSGGIDFIGQGSTIFNLPLAGSLLLVLNALVGLVVYWVERRAAWLLWAITPLLQIGLLISFFLLLYVNMHPYG
jgi:hypothetical protein